ncbi:hypothetical protein AZE42_09841 [Rhizopogon vesiculosus]|uniref:Uncharacterized protein n=1 Tax=Rhizopogon vesiculosus TaxID=180088 RepID=A0A1J8QA23_9AGAM|nr:hypothetical protein AZE42_09841 [Rhizopogon vesiculosus]
MSSLSAHFESTICDDLPLFAGRLVLDKEKFHQQSQNNGEFTEVDIDDLEPDDFDSGLGAEEDIADKRICDWGDDASLSNCVPSVMRMDTASNDGEGSGSKK